MATTPLRRVIPQLRRTLEAEDTSAGDGSLLARFVAGRDGDAFATLVRRHGPMVLGVCRRVLGSIDDAEDAFQATFLVLARKAGSLSGGRGLANWLYGVAYRTALKARATAARRRGRERSVSELPDAEAPSREDWDDLLPYLDAELSRLQPKYREAVVMCDLEGMTQKDAARRSGCPEGTLSSRLTRARSLLARRLGRRGVALTAGGLAVALMRDGTACAVPPKLLQVTVQAASRLGIGPAAGVATSKATSLSQEVMKVMLLGKLQTIAAATAAVATFVFATVLLLRNPGEVGSQEKPRPSGDASAERTEPGLVMRLGTTERQTAWDQIALSADGQSIVGIRGSRYIRVWDRATGRLRESFELPIEWPRMVNVLSPDGRLFITSGPKHDSLMLWDVGQRKLVREWIVARGQQLHTRVAFSSDFKHLAAIATGGNRNRLRVWDVASGKEVFSQDVDAVASPCGPDFSSDGKRLFAYLGDEGTSCWDIGSGKLVWQKKGFAPDQLIETPDGRLFPNESQYPILDAANGEPVGMPPEWHGRLTLLPDGKTVLATDGLGVVVWDLAKQEVVRKLPEARGPIALSADRKTLVASGGRLQSWDVATGKPTFADNSEQGHVDEATALAFDADGKWLISAGLDKTVRVWDLSSGKSERVSREGDPRPRLPLHLAQALNTEILHASPDGRWHVRRHLDDLSLWDVKADKQVRQLATAVPVVPGLNGGRILHARVNADGTRVSAVVAGTGGVGGAVFVGQPQPPRGPGSVVMWDDSGKIIDRHPIDLIGRRTVLSPDGRWLLEDGALVWTATGARSHRLEGVKEARDSVPYIFSPEGGLILGGASREVVKGDQIYLYPDGMKVWETATGKLVAHFQNNNWANQFWFHPGGRYVAVSVLEGVQVWDLLTGKVIADRKMPERVGSRVGHGCYAACAALSPDARRLATGAPDGSILIWEVNRPDESAGRPGAKELEDLWTDLASEDAGKAWTAVRKLAAVPADAVPFLGQRVKPVPGAPAEVTRRLISELDSPDFRVRESAAKKLVELGPKAETALRQALAASRSAEQGRHIEDLLIRVEKIAEAAGGEVRDLRAVAALRLIGSEDAKKVLRELAKGVERANLTREARAALEALN